MRSVRQLSQCLLLSFHSMFCLCFPGVVRDDLERGIRRQLTSQSARSRSPRHGQQEPAQLQGASVVGSGIHPAPGSSRNASSLSSQPPCRDLLADLFLANTMSAQKLHKLASSAAASGAQGLQDLLAAGAHGTAPQNMAIYVLRTCTRNSPWPAP